MALLLSSVNNGEFCSYPRGSITTPLKMLAISNTTNPILIIIRTFCVRLLVFNPNKLTTKKSATATIATTVLNNTPLGFPYNKSLT